MSSGLVSTTSRAAPKNKTRILTWFSIFRLSFVISHLSFHFSLQMKKENEKWKMENDVSLLDVDLSAAVTVALGEFVHARSFFVAFDGERQHSTQSFKPCRRRGQLEQLLLYVGLDLHRCRDQKRQTLRFRV